MRAGDILVCDASDLMIRTGQTDAKLLKRLHDDGVAVNSVPGLHSKVMILGTHAILGSANMSGSRSIEASVVTDRTQVRSGVASYIAQLARPTAELDGPELDRLYRIKVVRTGGRGGPRNLRRTKRLASTTWIVGVRELVRDPSPVEQKQIDRSKSDLNKRRMSANHDYDWIRWPKDNKFADECREGDTIISIWSPRRNGRRYVTRGLPVLLKRNEPQFCRFYLGDPVTTLGPEGPSFRSRERLVPASGRYSGSIHRPSPEVLRLG